MLMKMEKKSSMSTPTESHPSNCSICQLNNSFNNEEAPTENSEKDDSCEEALDNADKDTKEVLHAIIDSHTHQAVQLAYDSLSCEN